MKVSYHSRITAIAMFALLLPHSALAQWKESALYSFQGGKDGYYPTGGLVLDQFGNIYGVTQDGGAGSCGGFFSCGTVYELSPPARRGDPWTKTTLHNFQGVKEGDGISPSGSLLMDDAGNLYGMTAYGGTGGCVVLGAIEGCGTIFEMVPPKTKGGEWTEKVLYSFKGGTDGFAPNGALNFDGEGNLYGATVFGGGKGTCDVLYQYCGTVFVLSPSDKDGGVWTEKVLYSFEGGNDGAYPSGGFVFGGDGTFYGTTEMGGNSKCSGPNGVGCGTAFSLTPTARPGVWDKKIIHRFLGGSHDGGGPSAPTMDVSGALLGTTVGGGLDGFGTIFELDEAENDWTETVLYTFYAVAHPRGALASDRSGNFYGATCFGGPVGGGAIFELSPENLGWTFKDLYFFKGSPNGECPIGTVTLDESGNIYGITQYGGTGSCQGGGCGTVFKAMFETPLTAIITH